MRAVAQMFVLISLYMCTAHMCAAFAPGSLRMCTTPREDPASVLARVDNMMRKKAVSTPKQCAKTIMEQEDARDVLRRAERMEFEREQRVLKSRQSK